MTYAGFLARFLLLPIVAGAVLLLALERRGRERTDAWRGAPVGPSIALLVVVAVVYTTPWDNYLVATGVWWYDPDKVLGLVIGWVPIEEYTFFVLQPILAGFWLGVVARLVPPSGRAFRPSRRIRATAAAVAASAWAASVGALVAGPPAATYLALELAWGLPPVALQLGFGADILAHRARHVALAIVPLTAYLAAADAVAIASGTWTIDPAQSLGVMIGPLPLEELVFFALTNTLVVLGLVLLLAPESRSRLPVRR